MSLSYKEVAEILKIIDASSCEEVVLELENTRLVVRRSGASTETANVKPVLESPAATQAGQNLPVSVEAVSKGSTPDVGDNNLIVRSPTVGTFYIRPSPDEAPFVSEGARVTVGDRLCLIEVMKLYTTIEATIDGVIESILVENGSVVEFDQPLFVIGSHGS